MATVTRTEYTPEDLLTIRDRPMPELVDGELVEREMGQKSDSIAVTCLMFIAFFVRKHGLGLVNGAQGSYQIFPDQPNKVRIPDVSFTRRERLPQGGPAEGHGQVAPDLIVEVVSPNDEAEDLQRKINDFLSVGVPLLWIVYPDSKTVMIYRLDGSAQILKIGDAIDGEGILPGFRLPVADIFA